MRTADLKFILFTMILISILLPAVLFGYDANAPAGLGVVEKTGATVPLDAVFHDEQGNTLKFGDVIRKPTILTLVYLTCDHVCPQVLGGLAFALPGLKLTPGKDYQLVTVSFDADDDPALARQKKANYLKAAGRGFPPDAWKFLTGDRESIERLTDALGFHYRHDAHGFIHPVVLVFLSPKGVITGYHYVSRFQYGAEYPVTFSIAELAAGIASASRGELIFSGTKPVLYCFTHQPEGQDRFFNLLAVTGIVTLLSAAAFFIYLRFTSGRS